jgi:hypothetical protein
MFKDKNTIDLSQSQAYALEMYFKVAEVYVGRSSFHSKLQGRPDFWSTLSKTDSSVLIHNAIFTFVSRWERDTYKIHLRRNGNAANDYWYQHRCIIDSVTKTETYQSSALFHYGHCLGKRGHGSGPLVCIKKTLAGVNEYIVGTSWLDKIEFTEDELCVHSDDVRELAGEFLRIYEERRGM